MASFKKETTLPTINLQGRTVSFREGYTGIPLLKKMVFCCFFGYENLKWFSRTFFVEGFPSDLGDSSLNITSTAGDFRQLPDFQHTLPPIIHGRYFRPNLVQLTHLGNKMRVVLLLFVRRLDSGSVVSNIFYFQPENVGKMNPIWRYNIFQMGLKQKPPTRWFFWSNNQMSNNQFTIEIN